MYVYLNVEKLASDSFLVASELSGRGLWGKEPHPKTSKYSWCVRRWYSFHWSTWSASVFPASARGRVFCWFCDTLKLQVEAWLRHGWWLSPSWSTYQYYETSATGKLLQNTLKPWVDESPASVRVGYEWDRASVTPDHISLTHIRLSFRFHVRLCRMSPSNHSLYFHFEKIFLQIFLPERPSSEGGVIWMRVSSSVRYYLGCGISAEQTGPSLSTACPSVSHT